MHHNGLLVSALVVLAAWPLAAQTLPSLATSGDFANVTFRLVSESMDVILRYKVINHTAAIPSAYPHVVAEIISNESYDQLGWDFVQVTASKELLGSDDRGYKAYYAAGYLEGYVTSKRIGEIYVGNNLTYPQPVAVMAWVEEHMAYMANEARSNLHAGYPSAFWTQIGNHLAQLEGMAEGYMQAVIDSGRVGALNQPNLTYTDIFVLNFNNEIYDIYNVVQNQSSLAATFQAKNMLPFKNGNLHCSALVKVTDNDVFFSHVTWGGYNTMVRQYKVYKFQTTVSMSSVAGTIASGDDWYVTSNKLSVQETTNDYYNMSLVKLVSTHSASEFLRVMTANFLGTGGRDWVELFQYNNSGTYCNQWMVLDYKLYAPGDMGSGLQDDLLWVAEQIPGNVTSADVTETLRNTSYWASFNIPYFKNIYDLSGFLQLYEQFGDVFSYTKYARPEIFKRNQTLVKDLETMRGMMRYNDWQHDPLSVIPNCPECNPQGNPWLVIASRGDLINDTTFVLPTNPAYASQFKRAPQGGLDAKIASYDMMLRGMGNVICGPTSDQQPVFNFDEAFPGLRPPGSANVFDFPWTYFNVVGQTQGGGVADNNHTRDVIIGVCIGVPGALIAVALVVIKYRRSSQLSDGKYAPVNTEGSV